MTVATGVYDALVAKVIATLTTYTELPESYSIEENPTFLMKKGFAVGFGPEINLERHLTNLINFEREFSVILVNKVTSTFNDRADRAVLEKALVEDAFTLIKALQNDLTLGAVATVTGYRGQTGIEYITSANGSEKFISVMLTIPIEYQGTF